MISRPLEDLNVLFKRLNVEEWQSAESYSIMNGLSCQTEAQHAAPKR